MVTMMLLTWSLLLISRTFLLSKSSSRSRKQGYFSLSLSLSSPGTIRGTSEEKSSFPWEKSDIIVAQWNSSSRLRLSTKSSKRKIPNRWYRDCFYPLASRSTEEYEMLSDGVKSLLMCQADGITVKRNLRSRDMRSFLRDNQRWLKDSREISVVRKQFKRWLLAFRSTTNPVWFYSWVRFC